MKSKVKYSAETLRLTLQTLICGFSNQLFVEYFYPMPAILQDLLLPL